MQENKQRYTCSHCDERLLFEQLVESSFPEFAHAPEFLRFAKETLECRDEQIPKPKMYHRVHQYAYPMGGTTMLRLCGPVHEETDQEYLIYVTRSTP